MKAKVLKKELPYADCSEGQSAVMSSAYAERYER